jgi:apolipoprotein N-acyltransferase
MRKEKLQMFPVQFLIWLALGGLLQLFGFGKWMIPAAAWLVPVFLLHFARGVDPLAGALGIWLVLWIAIAVANQDVIRVPRVGYFGVTALIAALAMLAYLADRLGAPRLPGFTSTLVFPLAWVTIELVNSRANPLGTWGAVAYTQYGNLPLMQLASVVGIWGIAFLITWFGSVVNWAWDNSFNWTVVQNGVPFYAGVFGLVMLWGGARIAFASSSIQTVRIAGIGWPRRIIEPGEIDRIFAPDFGATEREQVREKFVRLHDAFFERSRREAQAGAVIVAWPEANLMVFKEDEDAFLDRVRHFAGEHAIFLLMGTATLDPGAARPVHNHAVLVDPTGKIEYSYTKITAVPGFEARTNIRGQGPIPVADTPYGRIVSPICYDLDFPQLVRQAGLAKADIMLAPASDWKTIGPLHQHMSEFRAIENGVAMFRIARWGQAGAVDPYGRPLAAMDDFASQDNVLVAQVPIKGVRTIYARIGDLFAWLCVAGLLISIGAGIYRVIKAR